MGQNITLDPGTDRAQTQQSTQMSQFGITALMGGYAVDAMKAIEQAQSAKTGRDQNGNRQAGTEDKRLAALYAAKAALTLYNGINGDAEANNPAPATPPSNSGTSAIKATVSIGSNSASSQSDTRATQNQGSTLSAGQTLSLSATGNGQHDSQGHAVDGDITASGTQISGTNIDLTAARDITLQSTQDSSSLARQNKSASASIGVGFGLGGQQNGFTIELAAARDHGDANGLSVMQQNTHVTASDTLTINSGRDTTLKGAQASAQTIKANVGGNLNIESLQDSDTYTSKQSSAGFSASICVPPICYGNTVSGAVSQSKGNVDSTFQSVNQQSGLYAGVGGFDITVGKNTGLKAAVIASDADASKNTLTTGTLTTSDVLNQAQFNSEHGSMSLSYSGGSATQTLLSNAAGNTAGNVLPANDGTADGTTKSAISPGTINITGDQAAVGSGQSAQETIANLNRDTANANGRIDKIFDLEQIQKQEAYQKAVSEVAQLAAPLIYNQVGNALKDQPTEIRVAVHSLVGGLLAKAIGGEFGSGAAGAGAAELAMELFGKDLLAIKGMSIEDKTALVELVGLTVSKIVASAAGADDSVSNAASITAKLAVENNWLKHNSTKMLRASEQEEFAYVHKECAGGKGPQATCAREVELATISAQRDLVLAISCSTQGSPADCRQQIADARANGYAYDQRTNQVYLPEDGRPASIGPTPWPGEDTPQQQIAKGVKDGVEMAVVDRVVGGVVGGAAAATRAVRSWLGFGAEATSAEGLAMKASTATDT